MIVIKGPKGIREVKSGEAYKLSPGEHIIGTYKEKDKIDHIAKSNYISVGDLINSVTSTLGFKQWWAKMHRGECMPCKRRQAALNYFQFKGPKWLAEWTRDYKLDSEKGKDK